MTIRRRVNLPMVRPCQAALVESASCRTLETGFVFSFSRIITDRNRFAQQFTVIETSCYPERTREGSGLDIRCQMLHGVPFSMTFCALHEYLCKSPKITEFFGRI